MSHPTNRQAEPEVWFRIVHLAQVGKNRPLYASYREHTVEVALGLNGVFEKGDSGLRLRAPPRRVVKAASPSKPAKQPKTPRVVELLRKAIEWKRQLNAGEIRTQADIANRERITRARVTQVMGMLKLAPKNQERILSLPDTLHRPQVTERALRPIRTSMNSRDQLRELQKILI